MKGKVLSAEGREQLALAILLLKDFKCQGLMDLDIFRMCLGLAIHCEVEEEFNQLLSKIPPMKIEPR